MYEYKLTLITPNQLLAFSHHQEAVVNNSYLVVYITYVHTFVKRMIHKDPDNLSLKGRGKGRNAVY